MNLDGLKRHLVDVILSHIDEEVPYKSEEFKSADCPRCEFVLSIEEEGKEDIDPDALADSIVASLSGRLATYHPTILSSTGGICPKCYRPQGVWISEGGQNIPEGHLMKQGTRVLMVDEI